MKFCPECGSILNDKNECDTCGYNKVIENDKEMKVGKVISDSAFHIPRIIGLDELKKKKVEISKLKSISYSFSNGMLMNDMHSLSINFEMKYIEKKDSILSEKKINSVRYSISDDELNNIKSKIDEYNLPAWVELEFNIMMMPSDESKSLTITYEMDNKRIKNYNIMYFCFMDEEERKIYNDFMSYIYSLVKEENIITNSSEDIIENKVESDLKYCPECGRKFEDNISKCECGYERG